MTEPRLSFIYPGYEPDFNGSGHCPCVPPKWTLSSPEESHKKVIQDAMAEFAALTCVSFVERKAERDYLNIQSADGWVEW